MHTISIKSIVLIKSICLQTNSNPNAILRQCISLETLKAAKNRDCNGDRVRHNSTPSSGGQATANEVVKTEGERGQCDHPRSSSTKETATGHRRCHSHGTAHDIKSQAEHEPAHSKKAAKVHRRPSLKDDRLLTAQKEKVEQARARSPPDPPVAYSPKLGVKQSDTSPKQRKIKLPHKAADLFAKLQMRLSSSKM